MYDPFVLYDSPIIEVSRTKPRYLYPGEVFAIAVEQAKNIEPIKGLEDTDRYYNELCKKMDFPSPKWMAEKALAKINELIDPYGDNYNKDILGKAFKVHHDLLEMRVKTPEAWPILLPTSKYLFDSLKKSSSILSVYDVNTREPYEFQPENINILSIHNILSYTLIGGFIGKIGFGETKIKQPEQIECPLKNGIPFYCHSADSTWSKLCVYALGDEKHECLADIFERVLRLSPPY